MTATLRHQFLDDGRVLITGGPGVQLRLTEAQAKRFAWGLLADLDPEGAEDAGYRPPAIYLSRTEDTVRDREPWGSQQQAIIDRLTDSAASTLQIAAAIGRGSQHTAVQLSKLKTRGIVQMTRRGAAGFPAMWALGDVTLDDWRARHPAGVTPK